ncbi:hypothetical protein [Paenibacillus sp. 481]|uniref:hypothetical protein n=1 Tax=Paenibacillus sp. 481 TaxID=2835869 RepID=UPI001E3411AC|nr:hypothetical protein [Paenibacillus sp. 481]UHA72262.1 hypothetical protein KIK04_16425 [Paenibacillus sp. 481]
MRSVVTSAQAESLLGRDIYALKKDGAVVTGKLVRVTGNQLVIEDKSDKPVKTRALLALALFDLLAIGTLGFWGGGCCGGGWGGYPPPGYGYGPYPPGYGGYPPPPPPGYGGYAGYGGYPPGYGGYY